MSEQPAAIPSAPADRHRAIAATFAERVAGAEERHAWNRQTAVPEWVARDVVRHLIDWLPGLLAAGSEVRLAEVADVDVDPVTAWQQRAAAVQAVLDDPEVANSEYTSQMFGELTVAQLIDRFYTVDIFMHTWDLARATGQPDRLDDALATEMFTGMSQIADVIRSSGQFGEQQPVPEDADATDRLVAFIGRDPRWKPSV